MKKGFLNINRDNSHENDESKVANLATILELATSLGARIKEEKSTTGGPIFDPSWMGQDSTPEGGLTPQSSAHSAEPHNAAQAPSTASGTGDSGGLNHPGNWKGRQSRCIDLVQRVNRTMALSAATAYLGGTEFLGGYTKENDLILSDAYIGEKSESASKSGDPASTGSSDELKNSQLYIPRVFRITSRRVYGRVLSLFGIPGLNEANMPSAPFAIVGATVNIPRSETPEGSNQCATLLIVAPLANLGRRPDRDGGLAQPMTDIPVGSCVVGTIEALDNRERGARFGYIEWTLTSPQEWLVDAPKSYWNLEHSMTTDLYKWSLYSFEYRILLPHVPPDADLVAFASRPQ